MSDIVSTTIQPNWSKNHSNHRIYLINGNLNMENLIDNNSSNGFADKSMPHVPSPTPTPQIQTSFHIYIIFVIGFMPACLGLFVWCIENQCVRKVCFRKKSRTNIINNDNTTTVITNNNTIHQYNRNNNDNFIKSKSNLNSKRYNNDDDQIAINQCLNKSDNNNSIVLSRPMYSFEMPRKCLEMIEILGEGNFGQVWKARNISSTNKDSSQLVAVKTNKCNV